MNRLVSSVIYDLEGQPLIDKAVTIELMNASYAPEGVYVPSRETYRTDETGKLTAVLWANESGDLASLYRATFPGGDVWTFTLPAGETPLTWQQVRALGVTTQEPQYPTLAAYVADEIDERLATGGVLPTDENGLILLDAGLLG